MSGALDERALGTLECGGGLRVQCVDRRIAMLRHCAAKSYDVRHRELRHDRRLRRAHSNEHPHATEGLGPRTPGPQLDALLGDEIDSGGCVCCSFGYPLRSSSPHRSLLTWVDVAGRYKRREGSDIAREQRVPSLPAGQCGLLPRYPRRVLHTNSHLPGVPATSASAMGRRNAP